MSVTTGILRGGAAYVHSVIFLSMVLTNGIELSVISIAILFLALYWNAKTGYCEI